MMSVAVCTGVSTCSHSAAATRPKANPLIPTISAPMKVARRKIATSRSDPSMCPLQS
jgi:sulfite reductase beta subunit-like hemoprotein